MNEPFLGYHGIDNLRYVFSVRNRPRGACRFPDWTDVDFDCNDSDPARFFSELLTRASDTLHTEKCGLVEQCEIAPGLGAFIEFSWEECTLTRCSAQSVVVPNGTLGELLSSQAPRAVYYRFDFSIKERGNLFDHPFPHAHSYFDGEPRFPMPMQDNSFPLFRWLEFLMLNHHYPLWLNWAKDKCNSSAVPGLRTPDREPEDFFKVFPKASDWNDIPLDERDAFVGAAKRTLHNAIISTAADFPKIPDEYLALNYWSQ